ncbi:MAG TPA: class I SAM-dependent methyltransferase [Blastocatellia bacterium]|nr:class I SAM-dependent methyltransferase [Blastocatellia bacterium]
MRDSYKKDLAFIHDRGFGGISVAAAAEVARILRQRGIDEGLVVDLGCGSGALAGRLCNSGYSVLGLDISPAMINLARKNAPAARFKVGSLFDAELPPCVAVTSIGECVNYVADGRKNSHSLSRLFKRVFEALKPGGIFLFDIAEHGQVALGTKVKSHLEGDGWAVMTEKCEEDGILTRRIVTFRRSGRAYRRSEELHVQQLYRANEIAAELRSIGFTVRRIKRYGDHPLLPARTALVAGKRRE